ncbi:MAG: thioredoxin family protein [Campylobacterales bacterium]|nr:thioredoxin family protein [Campylobacterales bacterium]
MTNKDILPVHSYNEIKEKIGNGRPTVLSFGMSHCYSCIAMSRVFYEILQEHPELQIYSIDSQKDRIISRDIYRLKEMPAQIFLDEKGEELFRHTGAYKKPVAEVILRKYGFTL